MADEESPVFQDILVHSTAMIHDNNEDSLFHVDFTGIDVQTNVDYPIDLFSLNYSEEEESILEKVPIEQFLSYSNFDTSQNESHQLVNDKKSMTFFSEVFPAICPKAQQQQQHIVSSCSSPIDVRYHLCISLSFINPPESIYHVRYLSEITDSSLDGNLVDTRKNMKKNVSGRYLKGQHGRHITIKLPSILSDNSNLFIRVTRLTVPYHDVSFVHPYPLLYSCPKKKMHSDVIIQGVSIYYKLNKQDICSQSKQFPNIILTRLKQCHLKHINNLYSFDNNEISYPFIGNNVKNKIAIYQLKKSQLDFRLVIKCEQTGKFFDTNISCRSNALLEEEGIECKKSSTSEC